MGAQIATLRQDLPNPAVETRDLANSLPESSEMDLQELETFSPVPQDALLVGMYPSTCRSGRLCIVL